MDFSPFLNVNVLKGSVAAGDRPPRHLRQGGGKLLVVERRALLDRVRVDQHERVAALDRPAVPEAVRLFDPRRRARDVQRGGLVLLAQAGCALVVGRRLLPEDRRRHRHREEERREDDNRADQDSHAADSTRNLAVSAHAVRSTRIRARRPRVLPCRSARGAEGERGEPLGAPLSTRGRLARSRSRTAGKTHLRGAGRRKAGAPLRHPSRTLAPAKRFAC